MNREHTLCIEVRNQPGALTKIASIFYRHDHNIESITVGKTAEPQLSKMLISVPADARDIELLRRQIENLIDVKSARLLDRNQAIMLEGCLMRLAYDTPAERREIMASAHPYRPRIRKVGDRSISLEIVESPEIVDDFVAIMKQHQIFDMSRTGMTALGPDLPPVKRESQEPDRPVAELEPLKASSVARR